MRPAIPTQIFQESHSPPPPPPHTQGTLLLQGTRSIEKEPTRESINNTLKKFILHITFKEHTFVKIQV